MSVSRRFYAWSFLATTLVSCNKAAQTEDKVGTSTVNLIYPSSDQAKINSAFKVNNANDIDSRLFHETIGRYKHDYSVHALPRFYRCDIGDSIKEAEIGAVDVSKFGELGDISIKYAFHSKTGRLICMEVFQPKP